MEAVEFMKKKARMCDYYYGAACIYNDSCENCPAQSIDCGIKTDEPERLVAIVEKWAKDHPEGTEQEQQKPERERQKPEQKRQNPEQERKKAELHDKTYALREKVDHTTTNC